MRIKLFIIFLSLIVTYKVFSSELEKRNESFSTSIIVPCASDHIYLLEDMIMSYQQQSILPNEMVISLSGYCDKYYETIKKIENKNYNFPVFIFKHIDKKYVGENRNIAMSHASGDIFILQDADDLPHPRRVEIVKFLFENYKIDHLFHLWMTENEWEIEKTKDININKMPIKRITSLKNLQDNSRVKNHNGAVCFLKYVFDKVKHPVQRLPGSDIKFNNLVYSHFSNCACVYMPLYIYRPEKSYYKKHNIYL